MRWPKSQHAFRIEVTDKILPAAAVVEYDPMTCDYVLVWGYDSSSSPRPGDPGVEVETSPRVFTSNIPNSDPPNPIVTLGLVHDRR